MPIVSSGSSENRKEKCCQFPGRGRRCGSRMILQRNCPPAAKHAHELAMSSELYLVRQVGPTAWMVGTRGGDPYRVSIGQIHTCSCPVFRSSRDICVHLAWILLRKLGIPSTNPLSYQLGMSERELNECLCPQRRVARRKPAKPRVPENDKVKPVKRRPISPGSACPICLEGFSSKQLPVVYCKYSCGQGMHGRCMEVVAKHQNSADLTCPLCRGHFSTISELRQAIRCSLLPPLTGKRGSCQVKQDQLPKWNQRIKFGEKERSGLRQTRPKFLPKLERGPSALLEDTPSIKCPICTDQGFSIVTLECGHLIPTPDHEKPPSDHEDEFKRPPRTPCGRLSRRGPLRRQFTPPPEVVVQRLQLSQRTAPPLSASRPHPRPKKKKETPPEPQPPDPRENGRILGSKVLPLMALLLQRKANEDDEEDEAPAEDVKPPEKPSKEEQNGKRRLTIQCVQLLPDAEAMPVRPRTSRHACHR